MTVLNTPYLVDVTGAMIDKLTAAKGALGLEDIWYGDQDLYPRQPCIAVEPVSVDRTLAGASLHGTTENQFQLFLYIVHGTVKDVMQNRRDADELCKNVELLLHGDLSLGGTVIHGFVTRNEPGQAARGSLLAVTRLTWEALTKTLLGV
jgi:hypothetical protein